MEKYTFKISYVEFVITKGENYIALSKVEANGAHLTTIYWEDRFKFEKSLKNLIGRI